MQSSIFGGKILFEMSHKPAQALKQKNSLFDFSFVQRKEDLLGWIDHLKKQDIPFLVILREQEKKSRRSRRYILLKRKFCYDSAAGEFHLKNCSCNPLDKDEYCLVCQPTVTYTRNSLSQKK